jgi:hypothetical protein
MNGRQGMNMLKIYKENERRNGRSGGWWKWRVARNWKSFTCSRHIGQQSLKHVQIKGPGWADGV